MKERDKVIGVLILLTFELLISVSLAYDPATCIQCRKSHVCNPPDCFCCRDEMPIKDQKIPQMVFFTFDDAVNPPVAAFYKELFDSSRVNPNGCPIKMTLFISHSSTVYSLVHEFYQKGMEIASHSVTHSNPDPKTFLHEAKKQKENLVKKAKIPESEIKGWRSPFLKPLGDTQPDVLKQLGYEYDATLTIIKPNSEDKAPIPFTLDYGWPYDCKIQPCPKKEHKGFWEVPVISVRDYLDKYDCVYIDGCNIPPPSEALAYQFLWKNFENYYKTNRAPMGINMHASWFYYPDRKKAMSRFIQDILKLEDVYIVSVSQVIAWLRNPTPLSGIKDFAPWQCNGNKTSSTPKTVDLRPQLQKQRRTNIVSPSRNALVRHSSRAKMPRKTVVRVRPTNMPAGQTVVYSPPLRTRAPPRIDTHQHFVQGLQNALVIRPAQTPVSQAVMNVRPVHANIKQSLVHIRPETQRQLSHVLPSHVPLFPWTRQQFLAHAPNARPQPPLAPNSPIVRFWWRPPEMRLPHQQPNVHIVRPTQRLISQDMMQQNMRRYQELQMQHQVAQKQALERQQREQIRRREQQRRQQQLKRLQELRKQKEILQKQALERQKLEQLKKQEQLKRQQEAEMKRKIQRQKELEKQRLIEMTRQQQYEKLRIEELKQQQIQQANTARKIEAAREQQNHGQLDQLFLLGRNRKKVPSKQEKSESKKIKQLKQLAETNFLQLREREKHKNRLLSTTAAPGITPKLGGRTMWQLDSVALMQLKAPWRDWVTEKTVVNNKRVTPSSSGIRLSEYEVQPVKKVKVPVKENKGRFAPLKSFKPQTVFSISGFQGPKSFSILGNKKYSKKTPNEVLVRPFKKNVAFAMNSIAIPLLRDPRTSTTKQPTSTVNSNKQTTFIPITTTTQQNINDISKPVEMKRLEAQLYNIKPTSVTSRPFQTMSTIKQSNGNGDTYNQKPTMTMLETTPTTAQDVNGASETTKIFNPGSTGEHVHRETQLKSNLVTDKRIERKQILPLNSRCMEGENCLLPDCLCKAVSPLKGLRPANTPQIVYITIDGSIDFHSYSNIRKIFQKQRVNPNGCPIKGTIFATDADSNHLITKMLHSDGFEVGMKGLNSVSLKSAERLEKDIHSQMQKLVKHANIPLSEIKGWRSPDLKPLGDRQFEILKNASLYDSTLIVGKESRNKQKLWPFTLDYGWRERCEIAQCPVRGHQGVWEVPIIPVVELNKSRSCEYADSCTNQPYSAKDTTQFLMDNFNQYYKTNRAPFGIRLQQVWFHWHYTKNLSGLQNFLDEILKLEDVFVVPVDKMLEWMKNPVPLDSIKSFQQWSC